MYGIHPLLGIRMYTWAYTGADTTTGVDVVIPDEVPPLCQVLIIASAAATVEGTDHTDSAAASLPANTYLPCTIGAMPGITICTVKAVADTVNVSCIGFQRLA